MSDQIIDSFDPGIVLKETKITVSDERLRNLLIKTYETAQKECEKFRIYNLWSTSLSFSGALFLSLLTSDFKTIGAIDAALVKLVIEALMAMSLMVAIALLALKMHNGVMMASDARDKAIEDILKKNSLFKERVATQAQKE